MILAATLSLLAGGPGSGCNPAAGKCGRLEKVVSDKLFPGDKISKNLKESLKLMEKAGVRSEHLADMNMILRDKDFLVGLKGLGANAAYYKAWKNLYYSGDKTKASTFVHEFGHHLEGQARKLPSEFMASKKEFSKTQNENSPTDWDQAVSDEYQDWGTKNAPSSHANANYHEWFAECFKMYVYNKNGLEKMAPKTYGLISSLLKQRRK